MAFFGKNGNRTKNELDPDGFTSFQAAVVFCALGLLAAILLTPLLNGGVKKVAGYTSPDSELDRTMTGSISQQRPTKRYTIRKSVLQSDPNVPCIIYDDGREEGGC